MNNIEQRKINIEHDVNIHFEDKKRSRHFFWFMWIIYAVVMMTKSCFTAAMADIVEEGFLDKQETGFITMMFYIVYTPLQIPGGIMSDKLSPERLIEVGLLGSALCNTVIFFNQSYTVMLVAWMLNALSQFALWAAIFKVVSSQCVRSDRPTMIFLISLSPSAGILLSYAVAAVLPKWQLNFLVSALALLVLFIVLVFWDKHLNKYMKWDKDTGNGTLKIKERKKGNTASIFFASGFILMLFSVFFRDTVGQSSKSIGPTLLLEKFSISPTISNLLNLLVVFASILGILAAKLILKLGWVKNIYIGVIIGNMAALLCCIFFNFANNTLLTVMSLCLVAFTTTMTSLFTNLLSSDFVKYGKNATAAGLINAAASLGFLATSGATLSIAENLGWDAVKITLTILVALSIVVAAVALPLYMRFTKKESALADNT